MKTVYVKNRKQWRSWWEKNSKKAREVWLLYYKKAAGKEAIPYEDSVREALCFGWIDTKIKKIDEERYARRFTPRNPASRWSASNLKRAKELIREGRMTAAGLEVFDRRQKKEARPLASEFPKHLKEKFVKQSNAWENFNRFPPFYRRLTIRWIASAKKEETQLRRLKRLIDLSGENKRIKFM